MSYIVILMSFTAISPSIDYGLFNAIYKNTALLPVKTNENAE
jgi:hypothetical protein